LTAGYSSAFNGGSSSIESIGDSGEDDSRSRPSPTTVSVSCVINIGTIGCRKVTNVLKTFQAPGKLDVFPQTHIRVVLRNQQVIACHFADKNRGDLRSNGNATRKRVKGPNIARKSMVYEYEAGKKIEDTKGHIGKRNAVIYTRDKRDEDSAKGA
jgi:hypothetical protein